MLSSCVFMVLREVDLEYISRTIRWNLGDLSEHIECRRQISYWRLGEFAIPNSNDTIWKTKNFFRIFCSICGIYIKFQTFWKKRWWSSLICFRNYRLWKTSPDHSLKSVVSEHAFALNMIKFPKYLRNLHESSFIMCFHLFEKSRFAISLPYY